MRSQIIGTGSYVPEKVLTNADLEKLVDTNERVDRRAHRHPRAPRGGAATRPPPTWRSSPRSAPSRWRASTPKDIDFIVLGTITPDMPWPSSAAVLQGRLGNKKAFAFDVSAACAGSLYALSIADRYVATGVAKRALVIGAELLTRIVDWKDRNTCILFGDGAGAMVLGPDRRSAARHPVDAPAQPTGRSGACCTSPGRGSRIPLTVEMVQQGKHHLFMNGREVYKVAVRALEEVCREALAANGMTAGDVTYVCAHQANKRILDATLERLEIPASKCWMNLEKYGNTSSASLPMTLDEANRAGWLKPGDTILTTAIGAGMAWGAALIRW